MDHKFKFVNVVFCVVILLVTSVSMEDVFLGCIQSGVRERCFTYHDGGVDARLYRPDAVDFCAAHNNASLAIIDSVSVNDLLTTNRYGQAWIRLRRISYDKWIHASTTEDALERRKDTLVFNGNNCARFSTRDGFTSGKCDEIHSYLCGHSRTSKDGTCQGTLVGDMCAVVGTRSATNWYTARYYCAIDNNSDLLSVDIYPEYSDMLNGSVTGSPTGIKYWIDVTNQHWVWKDQVNDPVLGHMKYNNWKTGHPITRHDCAVVELSTGQWESIACSGNKFHPVCEKVTYANELRTTGVSSLFTGDGTEYQTFHLTTSTGNIQQNIDTHVTYANELQPTDDSTLFTSDGTKYQTFHLTSTTGNMQRNIDTHVIVAYTVAAVACLVAAASIVALIHYKRKFRSTTRPTKRQSASHEVRNNQHMSSVHFSSPQLNGDANASSFNINSEYENGTFRQDVPPLPDDSQPYEVLRQ